MSSQLMRHAFVRAVPELLEPDMLYISIDYVTTSHLCACGCGAEVVLPIHPTKWQLTFDGVTISMAPSIGSRTLPCRSHYWINKGRIHWANRMSDGDFDRALKRDQLADHRWHEGELIPVAAPPTEEAPSQSIGEPASPSSGKGLDAGSFEQRVWAAMSRLIKRS
jgi:hypothetical protein